MGISTPSTPTVPSLAEQKLALKLLTEEYFEVLEKFYPTAAWVEGDRILNIIEDPNIIPAKPVLHELAHELGDVMYVAESFFQTLGVDSEPVHDEIQRANLDKAGGPRRADGKVLKPEGWVAADVKRAIEEQIHAKSIHAYYADGLL